MWHEMIYCAGKQACCNVSTTQINEHRNWAPDSMHHVLRHFYSWIQTGSHSLDGPGCVEAAPCPGAPGEPTACAVRRVSHGPGLGWSDAGGTDLHPWVPHTGDSTLSHQHTATSSTKQSQGRHWRADRPNRGKASRMSSCYRMGHNETTMDTMGWVTVTAALCQVQSKPTDGGVGLSHWIWKVDVNLQHNIFPRQ